jgi:hypothetical protein
MNDYLRAQRFLWLPTTDPNAPDPNHLNPW